MGILMEYVGDTLRGISRKGWTDEPVNVLDWDINDVFNDSTTEVNCSTDHMTRVDSY